ncbi:hypothetical protein G3M48_007058 [Beauveria asiatica]|uniref:Zn(2)-C6 fungal-type domain-containing protein n=1 Tax=Beauveria asiatica TaxID=1069075 RepID=A0AAW0RMW9_9HYPO
MTRQITSCLTCRRRKVRCDRRAPVCSVCQRGNHMCNYQAPNLTRLSPDTPSGPWAARSQGYSSTLRYQGSGGTKHDSYGSVTSTPASGTGSPSAVHTLSASRGVPAHRNGSTLLLQDECFPLASPQHWASTVKPTKAANSIESEAHPASPVMDEATRDVLMNLDSVPQRFGDGQRSGAVPNLPLPYTTIPPGHPSFTYALMGSRSDHDDRNLAPYYPHSVTECQFLLDVFISNVEAVICLLHEPTLRQAFDAHLAQQELYAPAAAMPTGQGSDEAGHFEPLMFGIFFSAIYSMDTAQVRDIFGATKTDMLKRFESALISALDKESFTSSLAIPVLQAFVLFLTCRCRDDEMQQIWTLVGLAVRMAQTLGLHQEPTGFSFGAMDAIQVEIRRRLWYQIFYLDVRTAVSQGLPPVITTGSYTTRLPSNVDDNDLMPGQPPLPDHYDPRKFTTMTIQLVRLHGVTSMQKLLHMLPCDAPVPEPEPGTYQPADGQLAAAEEQEMRVLIEATLEKSQMLYLRYCDSRIPLHRLTLVLSNHIKWKFWIYYYYQVPHGQRVSLAPAQKSLIFSQSLNLLDSYVSMKKDTGLNPYRWMIDGHFGLHAASYVISVLEDTQSNATLDPDLSHRGKQLLQSIQNLSTDTESKLSSLINQTAQNLMARTSAEPEYAAAPVMDATLLPAADMSSNLDDWVNYLNDTI